MQIKQIFSELFKYFFLNSILSNFVALFIEGMATYEVAILAFNFKKFMLLPTFIILHHHLLA
ncbi:hypothetical protein HMPREF0765_1737 [Sphingobacterium spiritivorum ATCC 33300]|uniref:Uncharacterized protein n=1 Tax=Sphingobacterium spiritivorum ATCC 33300 TaxID=525372 RepID=C2FWN1_SPHSI|nr:hypothetical protein HMPREF0765_1737 [Sphingobacterium spiritivorum ATCC 33300]